MLMVRFIDSSSAFDSGIKFEAERDKPNSVNAGELSSEQQPVRLGVCSLVPQFS